MTPVTFLRIRPAEAVNEIWAATRRREGTLAVEVPEPSDEDVAVAHRGGLLVVSGTVVDGPAAFCVPPSAARALVRDSVDGWRVTVVHEGKDMDVLDALARTGARHLRTGRSQVAAASRLVDLPGLDVAVSVFVDTVEDACEAVHAGATDLLLRDWDTDRIGALRDALDGRLVERTALPADLTYDTAAAGLPPTAFTAWCNQVDGSGAARPRSDWAPGRDTEVPEGAGRRSTAWGDDAWRDGVPAGRRDARTEIREILDAALGGIAPTRDDIERLFRARDTDVEAIAEVADELRRRTVGDDVTFVINRNINYTNQCYFKCGFCAFSKGPHSLNLRETPYLMSVEEVADRSEEAWARGATEVCLQGGIHPDFTGDFYLDVVRAVKDRVPGMHIHGFTPLEVWQGAETSGRTVRELLAALKEAGLGTLPGTAAEILDDDVRRTLCPDKIRTSQWAEVMLTAHGLGIRSTATMMFGHVDGPRSWANHFEVIREIQRRTGGFTEFVPLPFVHMGAPIWLRGIARPGPTWDEVLLVHAVARIAFVGLIDNIQASWVKLGLDGAEALLRSGCNDVGGTLMDESISRAAGASHGTEVSSSDFRELILDLDRRPVRRNTVYEHLETGLEIRGHR